MESVKAVCEALLLNYVTGFCLMCRWKFDQMFDVVTELFCSLTYYWQPSKLEQTAKQLMDLRLCYILHLLTLYHAMFCM